MHARILSIALLITPMALPAQYALVAHAIAPSTAIASGGAFQLGSTAGEVGSGAGLASVYTLQSGILGWDRFAPIPVCKPITIQLVSGAASITAGDIDGGSADNVAILSLSASKTIFSEADLGANPVTLTVTDHAGHSAVCIATVTMEPEAASLADWMTIEE